MAGQGSLCQRILHPRCSWPAFGLLCAILLGRLTLIPSALSANDSLDMVDLRLRCDWQSTDARFWKVRLSIVDSETPTTVMSEIQNHSDSDLTSGAFEQSRDARTVLFQPRHAVLGGAVQLRVKAMRHAKLAVEVLSSDRADFDSGVASAIKQIPLNEVITGAQVESVDGFTGGTNEGTVAPTWSLQRIPVDELRLQTAGTSQLYAPGAELQLTVRANALVHHASRALNLRYSLYRLGDGETVATHRQTITVNARGDSDLVTIQENVPNEPGVYEIRCQLTRDDENIWSRFRKAEPPIVQVSRPLLVVSTAPQRHDSSEWTTVGEIRPSESSWSMGQWLPKQTTQLIPDMTQIPGVGQIPGVSQIQAVSQPTVPNLGTQEYAGEAVSVIEPKGTFQATLPVLTPGLPHRVTIRYPGTQATRLRIQIADADSVHPTASFRLDSGANKDGSASWKVYSFVHYPAGEDQIWLTNLSETSGVAFESVAVQAGPNLLNTLPPPNTLRSTVLRLPNIDWVNQLSADLVSKDTLVGCDPATIDLYRLWVASHRLQDIALASGMNGVLVPANSGARTWFPTESLHRRHIGSAREDLRLATLMKMMEASQLSIYIDLDPSMLLSGIETAIRNNPALTNRLTRLHGGKGNQYNLLHPLVQKNLDSLIRDATRACGNHSSFAGMVLNCEAESHVQPISAAVVDPGALSLFAQATGASKSFPELRAWAQQQGRTAFETWLRDDTRRVYQQMGELLSDKPLYLVMQPVVRAGAKGEAPDFNTRPFAEQWRSDRARLVPVEPFRYEPAGVLSKQAMREQQISSITQPPQGAEVAAILGAEANEQLLVRDRLLADTSQIIDRLDPSMLIVEWPIAATSLQTGLSGLLRSFASMPDGDSGDHTSPIQSVDPAAQTIRLSAGTIGGHRCVSIISLACWTVEVDLSLSEESEWVLVQGTDGTEINQARLPELVNNGDRIRVVLPAGQIAVLKTTAPTSQIEVRSWTARVSGGSAALDEIKRKVTAIAERIGTLSDFQPSNTLTNGGFEKSGGMGLVGWLHAQHPPGCVRIDNNEYIEGKHSVRLTTDESAATRTWLVSEMIEPPHSGRLAVSLFCRGELRNDDSAHRVRVSIEATRNGEPIQYTQDFEVPRNGQWGSRELVLEADGIEPETVDSLRLTIDSLSGGRVWIDDVQLHDRFPTAKERAVLQSQAFLAVRGLQQGNLTPSARLLNNYWARHLLTLGPAEKPKPVIESVKRTDEAPGVAERIRSWIPRQLRF